MADPQDDWWKSDKAITPGQPIITKRADPKQALETRKLQNELDPAVVAAQRDKAVAEAAKAKAEAETAQAKGEARSDPKTKAIQDQLESDDILAAIRQARALASKSFTTGFPGEPMAHIPGTNARDLSGQLRSIAANITLSKLADLKAASPNGASGMGALSDSEGALLRDSISGASLDQGQSQEALLKSLDTIDKHYRNLLAIKNGDDPRDPATQQKYGLSTSVTPPGSQPPAATPPSAPPSGGGTPPGGAPPSGNPPLPGHYNPSFDPTLGVAKGPDGAELPKDSYERVHDPLKAGVSAKYLQMLGSGEPADKILGYLKSVGITDPQAFATAQQQIEFRAKNPRVPLSHYDVRQLEDKFVPTGAIRTVLNSGGNTDLGAGTIAAADALSAFNMARLTKNPELTRAGIAQVEAEHPKSALGGTLVGGALAGATVEAGLARAGLTAGAGVLAPRLLAADAIYGGAANYGLHGEDATLGDVGTGALIGLGGGIAARGALGAAAGLVGPKGGRYATVAPDGVRPTIGQRFAGEGWVGDAANTTEQALQSIPVLGQMVKGARQEARDQWETAGYSRALREIPKVDDAGIVSATEKEALPAGVGPGGDAIAYTRKAFDQIYDKARSGMKFVPDQQYGQDFGQFQQAVTNGSYALDGEATKQLEKTIVNQVGSRMRNGELTGDAYKKAASDLRKTITNTSKPELKTALKDYLSILDAGARRNSDPAAVTLMDAADKGYAQFKPLKDAARMAGSDPGRFTVGELQSVERRALGKTNAYLEGDTYLSDYLDAGRGLKDTLPNSGSIDRGLATGALTGAAYVNPALPVAALGATLPYAPGIRKLVGAALSPRDTPKLNTLADVIRSRIQPSVGYAGAPLAVDYLGSQP